MPEPSPSLAIVSTKLAVFTSLPITHQVRTILDEVLRRFADAEVLVLAHAPQRSLAALRRSQVRNLKYHGWRWIPYQVENALRMRREARRAPNSSAQLTERLPWRRRLDALLDDPRVEMVVAQNLASEETVARLVAFGADLGLSIGGPILKPATFAAPSHGTINLHQGKLPEYRGMPPAFWELWNGEREVHVSVHRVEAGLDTGAVIRTGAVPVEQYSTPAGVRVRLDAISPALVCAAVQDILSGAARERAQSGTGTTNRRPRLTQEVQLLERQGAVRSGRAVAKSLMLGAYARAAGALRHRRDCVSVLLYHRVSDRYRDNVSCGVEAFDEHMRYLSDHHRVLPLARLLEGPLPSGDGPVVAVTFDDGYLDNYEYAAPILLKHGLSATFFVSTRIVDEQLVFEHDRKTIGHRVPTMSWDQMREMQAAGLSFGGHTANHVNMAEVSDAVAAAELASARAMLHEQLGITAPIFAYPYGGRGDMTPARVAQVQSAGYSANCSAYGGVNPLQPDCWNIKRFGVDFRFSVPVLRSRIYGWS